MNPKRKENKKGRNSYFKCDNIFLSQSKKKKKKHNKYNFQHKSQEVQQLIQLPLKWTY